MSTPIDRPAALAAIIEAHRETPFAWGVHDCCLWAATAVQVQTGEDPAARLRGTYATEAEAVALIKREFAGRIENIPGRFGFQRVPVLSCQRGWLVSKVFSETGTALGICVGTKAAFAAKAGLLFAPMSECRKAWRVG